MPPIAGAGVFDSAHRSPHDPARSAHNGLESILEARAASRIRIRASFRSFQVHRRSLLASRRKTRVRAWVFLGIHADGSSYCQCSLFLPSNNDLVVSVFDGLDPVGLESAMEKQQRDDIDSLWRSLAPAAHADIDWATAIPVG